MSSRHTYATRRNLWKDPLVQAFFVSATIHLLVFGLSLVSSAFGDLFARRLTLTEKEQEELRIARIKSDQTRRNETPLLFVDVNPAVATEEAPEEDTQYYSDKSSKAANPDADQETDAPKTTGTQTEVAKAEDTPRVPAQPLQPELPPPPEEPEVKPEPPKEEKPEPEPPGDMAMARPAPQPEEKPPTVGRPRPRTIAEALKQQGLTGEKMRQEGGVRERARTSFNVKGTPFGVYDAAVVAAIQNRWYSLLESRDFARERTGKVVLEFRLNYDGRITDMRVVENDVGELLALLCQKAVLDPAPYAAWPSDMRRMMDRDFREVRFTFNYL